MSYPLAVGRNSKRRGSIVHQNATHITIEYAPGRRKCMTLDDFNRLYKKL